MHARAVRLILIVLSIVVPTIAFSDNTKPMEFSWFSPCSGNNRVCYPTILAEGLIEADSDRKFYLFTKLEQQDPHHAANARICFNSPGGHLIGSVQLGQLIRKYGFDTCLAATYDRVIPGTMGDQETFVKDAGCASACAFAFLGGVNRSIETGSHYGIHQFYGAAGNIGDSATQLTVVILAAYIEQMGIDRALLDAASLVPSEKIHWVSLEDLRALRVDNMTVARSEWRLSPLPNGELIASIIQVKPGEQSRISLVFKKDSDRLLLVITFLPYERSFNVNRALQALDSMGEVALHVDNREIATYLKPAWKLGEGTLRTVVQLSPLAVQAIRSGKLLDLKVDIARAYQDYDPSLEFPLDGIGDMLNAVLR